MAKAKQPEPVQLKQWAPLVGTWEFTPTSARFVAPKEPTVPHGIALSPARLKRGTISVTAQIDQPTGEPGGAARIVLDTMLKLVLISQLVSAGTTKPT